MQTTLPLGEVEALSVGELTARLKDLLEGAFPAVWVRGEVSNLRAQSSGHVYFTLKDAQAQLAAVLFRGDAARQRMPLRDGQQIIACGSVSVYGARGQYQLIVREVVEDGLGRLQAEFERLKQRLAAEGLFEPANKVPLPAMPRTIGFITSPTGAAVQDFLRILTRRRWRGRVVVLPAKVQGEGAAAEMAAWLEFVQRGGAAGGPGFDLLVIGRGGGSLEDLWAFNEEPLVRAVATSRIPIISAVGHEIDFTLCDFAADVRAETPSAAAELISSRFLEGGERVARAAVQLDEAARDALARAGERLRAARDCLRLLTPEATVEHAWLRLDDLGNRLSSAFRQGLAARRQKFTAACARFDRAAPERRVQFDSQRLLGLWKRLQAASPDSVLQRGFAIVRDAQGAPIMRRAAIAAGARLQAQFADGTAALRAE